MKKRAVFILIAVMVLTTLSVFYFTPATSAVLVKKSGQWTYDADGNHSGCVSPGSDCTWYDKEMEQEPI